LSSHDYLMESDEEALRLELKTDAEVVRRQARWAGIQPGMRVADVGCGPGITTSILHELVQPGGSAVGIDLSAERLEYARQQYGGPEIDFIRHDVREPLELLGQFDFVWVRFFLEYHRTNSYAITQNISRLVKPGGILCLIDLDHNCLNHFGIPERMIQAFQRAVELVEKKADFDPYMGRKLYSFLYDLGFEEIQVDVAGHHVLYGEIRESDAFNFLKKVEIAPKKVGYDFPEYAGGFEEFLEEYKKEFAGPRRFTYSPLILCRGRRPLP